MGTIEDVCGPLLGLATDSFSSDSFRRRFALIMIDAGGARADGEHGREEWWSQ